MSSVGRKPTNNRPPKKAWQTPYMLFHFPHKQSEDAMAATLKKLEIPKSSTTIDVYIIDNGSLIRGFHGSLAMDPVLPGYEVCEGPSYAFLIHHKPTSSHLLFDLGVRTNWKTAFSPAFVKGLRRSKMDVRVDQDIADILNANGVAPSDIDTIIFSHHHFDHTGDTTKFPITTKILVGPGYKNAFLPGWPANPKCLETTADLYEGREIIELDFSPHDPKVALMGNFQAYDYFSDGSFYILSTPGHTIGHLSALARTTLKEGKSTFIFIGGDIVHTNAVFRPTSGYPLPDMMPAPNGNPFISHACPGEPFAKMHRLHSETDGGVLSRTTPFSRVVGPEHDLAESQRNADKLRVFDSEEDILTVWAHDGSLHDVLEFFPKCANEWREKGWKKEGHWRWLAPCMKAAMSSKL